MRTKHGVGRGLIAIATVLLVPGCTPGGDDNVLDALRHDPLATLHFAGSTEVKTLAIPAGSSLGKQREAEYARWLRPVANVDIRNLLQQVIRRADSNGWTVTGLGNGQFVGDKTVGGSSSHTTITLSTTLPTYGTVILISLRAE